MSTRHIVAKDLRLLTRDRRALTTLLLMPLLFIAILGFSTGKIFGQPDRDALLFIGVVDLAQSDLAGELIAALGRRPEMRLEMLPDTKTADKKIRDGEPGVVVIIGPDFHRYVAKLDLSDLLEPESGKLSGLNELGIEVRGRSSTTVKRTIVEGLVFAETMRVIAPHVVRNDRAAAAFLDIRAALSKVMGSDDSPSTQPVQAAVSPPIYGNVVFQMLVPSYTVMFAFFMINIMARSFLAERQHGTLNRLRAAPISAASLMIGKTVPFLLISVLQGVMLFVFGRILFGMSWGAQPVLLLPLIVSTSLAATALGLLVAVTVKTDAQVSSYGNLLIITLAGVSGCFLPREWMPELMRKVSLATPHAWSLIAYDQVLGSDHPDFATVWTSCVVLLIFTAAFFSVGFWRFRSLR